MLTLKPAASARSGSEGSWLVSRKHSPPPQSSGTRPCETRLVTREVGVCARGGRPPTYFPGYILLLVQAAVELVEMERSPAAKIAPQGREVTGTCPRPFERPF
eukprot:8500682-Pyramimonas_sp.AAC.1